MTRKAVPGGRSAERSKPIQSLSMEVPAWRVVSAVLALVFLYCLSSVSAIAAAAHAPQGSATESAASGHTQAVRNFQVPLSFEPNQGQVDAGVQFLSHGAGYTLFLTPGEAVLTLERQNRAQNGAKPDAGVPNWIDTVQMSLVDATTTASAAGLDPQSGIVNYFVGNDPRKWHTGIPTFGKVNYTGIYPGIDLVFYGNQRQLEYDFVVKPGGNPAQIGWSFRGAHPRLGETGSLELDAPGGPLEFLAPVAYQVIDGSRRPVSASFSIAGQTVRFTLGQYDQSQALIIDPVLSYFSYLGGTGNDYIGNANPGAVGSAGPEPTPAVGIDSLGDLYVGGSTTSTDFPVASPVLPKTTKTNTSETWAFISKFSPDGSKLLYSTYLGGSTGGNDAVYALAVDATGNVYATGTAGTNDFPVTAGAFQTLCAPHRDNNTGNAVAACTFNTGNGSYSWNAFALKLNPTGSSLLYSSFLGGYGATWGTGIAVDAAGQAYITGTEVAQGCSGDVHLYGAQYECFPTTANAVISDIGGGNPIDMAFMTVFNATGTGLVYSTLYGDTQGGASVNGAGCTTDCSAITHGGPIALDPSGNVYIGGITVSSHLLVTAGAFNTTGSGPNPLAPNMIIAPNGYGYVAKFAPVTASGTSLVYSTYFGGGAVQGGDVGGLAADAAGNAYITGETHAADFPATAGAWQTTCDPNQLPTFCNQDGYVAKLNPAGAAIVWASYLGNGSNAPLYFLGPVVVDSAQNVYVEGQGIGQLPLGGGTVSNLNTHPYVYVAKFNSTGSQVLFGAAVAGPGNAPEEAGGLAVDPTSGAIYVGGSMGSGGTYTGTTGAFQPAYAGGGSDGFVAKVLQTQPSTTTLSLSASSSALGQQVTLTAKVAGPQGSTVVPTGTVTFLSGSTTLGTGTLDSTGTATYSTSTLAASTYTLTASYGGDGAYSSSTSSAQTLVVNPDTSTTSLTLSAAASTVGQQVTLTAKVAGPQGGTVVPTGTITFLSGTTTLGTGTLDKTGTGTYSTSSLPPGSYTFTASYSGDSSFSSSTSSAQTLVVNPIATTTALAASATTVTTGASITFTATVSPASGAIVPTGTVTFKDGTTTLGTGTLDSTGKATYSTSGLATGSHSVAAVYGGDTDNATSTSAAVSITVSAPPPADFSLALSPGTGSVAAGSPATVTITLTPLNGFNAATTFACSGLPAHSTCTFSPSTVTPNGTAAATTSLTINSNVATAAIAGVGAILSFLVIPMAGFNNRRRRRLWAIVSPMLLAAVVALGLCACGGGSSGGGNSTNTPKGTYSITVTATSGSLSHTATYSYTVN